MDTAVTIQPTRWEILQLVKRQGSATVEQLARHLGVTPMAVRLHLVVLERDGMVNRGTLRHGPGRPALVYTLTSRAGDLFPKSYDVLASALLNAVRAREGSAGVVDVCRTAASQLSDGFRHRLLDMPWPERGREMAAIFNELGHDAKFEVSDGDYLLKVYNCPYQRVAEKHREICGLDRQMLLTLLDAEVERSQNLLDSAVHCTYVIRPVSRAGAEG